MKLFFDTETTGKADFKAAANAEHQPRIVQLGALLTEDDGHEIASVNLIIKPDGFTIPIEASAIHGITTDKAGAFGIPIRYALAVFRSFWTAADTVIAHNTNFDLLLVEGEMNRWAGSVKPWGEVRETFCTMQAMTPICKLPGKFGDYKWPKLSEAYSHCFNAEFDGVHNAMADVRACAKVYFWLNEKPKTT